MSEWTVRLRPIQDGTEVLSEQAINGLVGSTPYFGPSRATITKAWAEDGWVVVTLSDSEDR